MSLAVCRDRLTGSDAPEELCDASSKPQSSVMRCNTHPCPYNYIKDEEWSPCSVSCGEGWRKKEVHCKIFLEFSRTIAKLPDSKCMGPKPAEETERCIMEPCSMAYGTSFGDSGMPAYNGGDRWNYTDFSQCTKSCGIGIQTREVTCIHEVTRGGTNTVVVPNSMCPQPPPPDRQYCNVLDCPVRWHTGDWSKCSKTCGGGLKQREVTVKVGGSATIFYGTQGALRITSLSLRDHGVYTCVAGRSSANLTLLVKPKPGDRADGRYIAMIGKIDKVRDALYGTVPTSTKASPSYNSQARDIYDENEMLPPIRNSASRVLPCLHYIIMQLQMFWDFQTIGNSRGQRKVDVIMYQNYGVPSKTHVINLEDKQIVFPEDDDSDIIIVNEDYNRNHYEERLFLVAGCNASAATVQCSQILLVDTLHALKAPEGRPSLASLPGLLALGASVN
ncbi:ADAMTS-like protein 1, partial [Operophtera brumata]